VRAPRLAAGRPAVRGPRLFLASALALTGLGPGGAVADAGGTLGPLPSTAAEPSLEVVTYTVADREIGRLRIYVEGVVVNRGPGPATGLQMRMTSRSRSGDVLDVSPGTVWIDDLAEGATSPFSVSPPFCCAADIDRVAFALEASAAPGSPYDALAVEGVFTRDVSGAPFVFGELANLGDHYVSAAEQRLYVGFFAGERLLGIRAASMPINYGAGYPGRAFPPGYRLPWSSGVPDEAYDRLETWVRVISFPPGVYAAPLGLRLESVVRDANGVLMTGLLYNCGTVPVVYAEFVVVGRDAAGRIAQFAWTGIEGGVLQPGDSGRVQIRWRTARSEIDLSRVSVDAFSVELQVARPPELPCGALARRAYLPSAARAAEATR